MTSSIIDYRDKSIRLQDGRLLVVFKLLIKEGRELYANQPDILTALDKLDDDILNSAPGLFNAPLDGYWETDAGQETLSTLLARARSFVSSFNEFVPRTYLNGLIPYKGVRHIDVAVQDIEEWIGLVANLMR